MNPSAHEAAAWLPFLSDLADGADRIALQFYRTRDLRVDEKPDLSPVTEADRAIETMARRLIGDRHAELGVLGEEQGETPGTGARLIIDPIDGTRNFVRGIPIFGVLLAIEVDGEVAAGVAASRRWRGRWTGRADSGTSTSTCWWPRVRARSPSIRRQTPGTSRRSR